MRRMIAWLLVTPIAVFIDDPVAQAQTRPQPAEQAAPDEGSTTVVITGLRDLDDPESPVNSRTLGSSRTGAGAVRSRSVYAFSKRFARCAVARTPERLRLLRRTLDLPINSSAQSAAQTRLVQANAGCTESPQAVSQATNTVPTATLTKQYNASYYDRGALFVQAIQTFAPELKLTKQQTADPSVQARFNAREAPLARFRLPVDEHYFQTAVCLVRLNPDLATRLVQIEDLGSTNRLAAALVNRGKICVGGAKRVYFDATQFRFYIADALYRWMVAAQGMDSLIPVA